MAAMDQQVGIAADGRGEVRVGVVAQSEVAAVVRAVHGLLQRAQAAPSAAGWSRAGRACARAARHNRRSSDCRRRKGTSRCRRETPSARRASPAVGPSCTRYSAGCPAPARYCAAQTLAASMHSSISGAHRCARPRTIASILPCAIEFDLRLDGVEARWRRAWRARQRAAGRAHAGRPGAAAAPWRCFWWRDAGCDSQSHTCV